MVLQTMMPLQPGAIPETAEPGCPKMMLATCVPCCDAAPSFASPGASVASCVRFDPDWSWALQSAVGWLAAALGRGTEGIAFVHTDTVQALVLALHQRVAGLPATNEDGPAPAAAEGDRDL
jgi:hypothetical protein